MRRADLFLNFLTVITIAALIALVSWQHDTIHRMATRAVPGLPVAYEIDVPSISIEIE